MPIILTSSGSIVGVESIVLDPSEVASDRVELAITSWVDVEGVDWGDAQITAYMAEAERGEAPVDFRVPNRQVTIPLVLKESGATSFAEIRAAIQAKAALFQREGGYLGRTLSDGVSIYYLDIVNATLKLSGGWLQAHRDADIDAVLTLEAIPDFYGEEVSLADHVEATLPCLVFTDSDIDGDYPARVRLVVDEDDGDDQMFLMYGVQSKNYSADASAALFYEAEGRTPLGGAAIAAGITGSSGSGSNVVRQDTLTTTNQAMLSTQAASAGAHLSHVGTFHVWARTQRPTTNTGEVSVALEWGEGDFRKLTTNDPVVYAADELEGAYCLTDLGLATLSKAAQGAQQWEGRVVASSTVSGDELDIDCLFLVPVDEGYGEIRGSTLAGTPTSFAARDEFDQAGGALVGKTLPVGGTWGGAGDATDFVVESSAHTAQRTAVSDTAPRFALAGTTVLSSVVVQTDSKASALPNNLSRLGVFGRYVDTSNFLVAYYSEAGGTTAAYVWVVKSVAGSVTALAALVLVPWAAGSWYTTRMMVTTTGQWSVWHVAQGATMTTAVASGTDTDLATSGALDDGKMGLYDYWGGATAGTRDYDNFLAFDPESGTGVSALAPAVYASQSLEVRHDRVIREDSAGTIWTPVSEVKGDYLRLPPAGLEGRSTRIIVKGSRNDPDSGTDSGIDNLSARAHYRPSWLTVPA